MIFFTNVKHSSDLQLTRNLTCLMLVYLIKMHQTPESFIKTLDGTSQLPVMTWELIWPSLSLSLIPLITLMFLFLLATPPDMLAHLPIGVLDGVPSYSITSWNFSHLSILSSLVGSQSIIFTSEITIYYLQTSLWPRTDLLRGEGACALLNWWRVIYMHIVFIKYIKHIYYYFDILKTCII